MATYSGTAEEKGEQVTPVDKAIAFYKGATKRQDWIGDRIRVAPDPVGNPFSFEVPSHTTVTVVDFTIRDLLDHALTELDKAKAARTRIEAGFCTSLRLHPYKYAAVKMVEEANWTEFGEFIKGALEQGVIHGHR